MMTETSRNTDRSVLRPGRYRHFKGGEYEVLGVARHSEGLEDMVVYRPLYNDTGLWVRPLSMFTEAVERDGKTQPRFTLLKES
jgi:hypothetical protein